MEYGNNYKQINPLALAFIGIQVIFVIFLIISFPRLFQSNEISPLNIDRTARVEIENFREVVEDQDNEDWFKFVEVALFELVSANTPEANLSKTLPATIRNDTIKTQYFVRQNLHFFSAVVDIPDLQQSYKLLLEYSSDDIFPDYIQPYSALCLEDKTQIIYKDFSCKNVGVAEIFDYNSIVSRLIEYFNFSYFSVFMDHEEQNIIKINPIVTFDIDENTKHQYIEEVKAAISSLGISPEIFQYKVLTAKDMNFIIH